MGFEITDPRALALAAEISERTGVPRDRAILLALEHEMQRLNAAATGDAAQGQRPPADPVTSKARTAAILEAAKQLREVLTEDDFRRMRTPGHDLYDETGAPR